MRLLAILVLIIMIMLISVVMHGTLHKASVSNCSKPKKIKYATPSKCNHDWKFTAAYYVKNNRGKKEERYSYKCSKCGAVR